MTNYRHRPQLRKKNEIEGWPPISKRTHTQTAMPDRSPLTDTLEVAAYLNGCYLITPTPRSSSYSNTHTFSCLMKWLLLYKPLYSKQTTLLKLRLVRGQRLHNKTKWWAAADTSRRLQRCWSAELPTQWSGLHSPATEMSNQMRRWMSFSCLDERR